MLRKRATGSDRWFRTSHSQVMNAPRPTLVSFGAHETSFMPLRVEAVAEHDRPQRLDLDVRGEVARVRRLEACEEAARGDALRLRVALVAREHRRVAGSPDRRRDEREVAAERRDHAGIAVLARDALVVVQRAVELERLEEAAERRRVDRVRSLDHLAAAEVACRRRRSPAATRPASPR